MPQDYLDWPTRGELYSAMSERGAPRFHIAYGHEVASTLREKADACKLTPGFAIAIRAEAENNGGQRNFGIDRI